MKVIKVLLLFLCVNQIINAQDSIGVAGTYIHHFVEGYHKIKLSSNGKCCYVKELGTRGYFSKSGSWIQKNDSIIELTICGWNKNEVCSKIPIRIRGPFDLGKIMDIADDKFEDLFIRKNTIDSLGKVIYTYEKKSQKHHYEWIQRFANGVIYKVTRYKKGKLHGEQVQYSKDGKLVSRKIYKRGRLKFENDLE